MAVNDRRNDKTLFINVLCFGKMAENLQPKLVKGREASIQGKLNIDDYEDENNNKRSSVCIMADEISLGYDPASTASAKAASPVAESTEAESTTTGT